MGVVVALWVRVKATQLRGGGFFCFFFNPRGPHSSQSRNGRRRQPFSPILATSTTRLNPKTLAGESLELNQHPCVHVVYSDGCSTNTVELRANGVFFVFFHKRLHPWHALTLQFPPGKCSWERMNRASVYSCQSGLKSKREDQQPTPSNTHTHTRARTLNHYKIGGGFRNVNT